MTKRRASAFVSIVDDDNEIVNLPSGSPAGTPSDDLMSVQGAPNMVPVSTSSVAPGAGNIFSATISATAVTAAQDVFSILAPDNKRVKIREVVLSQYTDFGDAAAEIISVLVVRGYTTVGSGGSAITPLNFDPTGRSASAIVRKNDTTVAQDGTAAILRATSWNIQSEWLYIPDQSERAILMPNQRLVVRITAPADSITLNATLVFEELSL